MSDVRSSQIFTGILAFLLCAAVVSPVSASPPPPESPVSPIVISGTDNTVAVSHLSDDNMTVELKKDAVLKVDGGDVAVSLGAGGTVTLAEGANITNTKDAEDVGDVQGIVIEGSEGTSVSSVTLNQGSVVEAEVSGGPGVRAIGIDIDVAGGADIMMDGASLKTTAGNGEAIGFRVFPSDTAELKMENGSTIDAKADGPHAMAIGGLIGSSANGVATVTTGSSITATATDTVTAIDMTEVDAGAGAVGLGMLGVETVDITITEAKITGIMSAMATNTGEGSAKADIDSFDGISSFGLGAMVYNSATIQLTDATVMVKAEATARSVGGNSTATAGSFANPFTDSKGPISTLVSGLMVAADFSPKDAKDGAMASEPGFTAISLKGGSSIDVTATATAADQSEAAAAGIQLQNIGGEGDGDAPTLQLVDSTVRVSATATASATVSKEVAPMDDGSIATAIGVYFLGSEGDITFSMDQAKVEAEATAETGAAYGIKAEGEGGVYEITLSNDSKISAIWKGAARATDEMPSSAAVFVKGPGATITVDATSSLVGEWAVWNNGLDGVDAAMPVVTLNNRGVINGRLKGVTLNNASSGTLQATFGSADGFGYSDVPDAGNTFYFMTETATLEAGTTFRIIPTDNLGIATPGDSAEYAILQSSDPGAWNQKELNLVVDGNNSPLIGLNWSEQSTDKMLIAEIKFLTPVEADLSRNAGFAINAALADRGRAFVFGTDPEAWAPNVSGAFLSGMTQTLGASHTNIGNRLGGLMGLNTGDEMVAANGLWYNAAFTDADQGMRDGIVGFDADTAGLSLGLDRQAGPVTVGVACTVGKTDADADDGSSSMGMDDNLFSLYGSYDGGKWFGEAVLSAGFGDVASTRHMDTQVLTADYDSTSYNALAKVGTTLNGAGWQINPLLAVDYSCKKYDSYTEVGGSGALDVDSQDYTVLNVGGGASVQRSWVNTWGVLTPEVSAMLRYDLMGDSILTTAKFVGGSTAFVANGADPAETSWELSTALTVASLEESAVSLRLGYDYAGREDFQAHSVSGKVRFEF